MTNQRQKVGLKFVVESFFFLPKVLMKGQGTSCSLFTILIKRSLLRLPL